MAAMRVTAMRVAAIWMGAMCVTATVSGCHSRTPEPAAVYRRIHTDFLHGNLDLAGAQADQARQDFAAGRPRGSDEWSLKFRLLEAEVRTYQGRPRDVVALLTDTAVSYPREGDSAIERNLLNALAHQGLGERQRAGEELRDARRLAESARSALIGEVLRTEALLHVASDDLPEALVSFKASLEAARESKQKYLEATDLLNIGFVNLQMEHYDEALAMFDASAKLAAPIQARTVIEAALGNSGWAYVKLGDFEKALADFQLAEREAKEIGTTSAQINWLKTAGWADYKLGNLEDARKFDEEALRAAVTLHAPKEIVDIDINLAFLLYAEGQYDAAKTYVDAALQGLATPGHTQGDSSALYAMFLQARFAARQADEPLAERLLMQVHDAAAADPSLRWEVENALANLHARLHDSPRADAWYRRSIDTFENQRASVRDEELKLSFFSNGDALYRDYADFLIETHRPRDALRLLDQGRARTLEEGLGLADRGPQGLHAAEADDPRAVARRVNASILFYSLGPERSYLWAISAQRMRLLVLPKEAEIQALVQDYQKAILRSSDPLRDANAAALSLYQVLIAPAASTISNDSKIYIVADGILHGLNFETLLTPADGGVAPGGDGVHYWIDDVTVTNSSSILLLSKWDPRPSAASAKKLLLIGNPVSRGTEFESLPNAPVEIQRIQKHFAPETMTVLTQARAVPAAYANSRPDQFSFIHFVAHGTASRLSPLDSAVVLSADPGNADDFKLYARDIVNHPLRADLVTISTCYGSGLRAYAGEGLIGLSWAFLRAGSHHVIAALWEANDASTPLLMDELYEEIELGSPPDAALRNAKLSLIHSRGVYRKPLYWAAFQLYAGS